MVYECVCGRPVMVTRSVHREAEPLPPSHPLYPVPAGVKRNHKLCSHFSQVSTYTGPANGGPHLTDRNFCANRVRECLLPVYSKTGRKCKTFLKTQYRTKSYRGVKRSQHHRGGNREKDTKGERERARETVTRAGHLEWCSDTDYARVIYMFHLRALSGTGPAPLFSICDLASSPVQRVVRGERILTPPPPLFVEFKHTNNANEKCKS